MYGVELHRTFQGHMHALIPLDSIDQLGMFINSCVLYLALCQMPQGPYGILSLLPSTTVIAPLQHMLQQVYQSHGAAPRSEGSTLRTSHVF